jgi:hypothetical protein
MGGPPINRPMRRGMSKAVPIVVSAGLAVGVFCGLLFGVGKKSEAVAAAPASGTNVKPKDEPKPDKGAAPAGLGASTTPPAPAKPAAGSAVVAAGSAAPTTPTAPAVVEPKKIKLTVSIKPEGAAKDAKLIIDGAPVDGMTIELPADKKSVQVEVKSSGYRSVDKKIDIAGGDTAIEFEMAKRPSGGGTNVRPPKRPDKPPSGGGGLIDL